jgi:hyperosmotically inducible periplasmic protein
MFRRFLIAAAASFVMSAPAFATASDNLQLFRAVQKQVLQYNHFTVFDTINAQVDAGVVTLTGKVTMPYKRDDLERRVRETAGVRRVVNRIDVLPVSRWDDQLRVAIAEAIYSNPAFRAFATMPNPPIHVIVEHGHVTLDGVVLSDVDRAIARSIAGNFNAFSITNRLKTEAEVREELERL